MRAKTQGWRKIFDPYLGLGEANDFFWSQANHFSA